MAETEEVKLSTDGARRELDALIAKGRELKQTLQDVGSTLSANPSADNAAKFFRTAQEYSTVQGAIQSSAGVQAGAVSGAMPFARNATMRSVADPQGILGVLQSAGVSQGAISSASLFLANGSIPAAAGSSFNPASFVSQIIASAQVNAHNPFSAMPTSGPASNLMLGQFQNQTGPYAVPQAYGPSSPTIFQQFPSSPANPNAYGPAAPGSLGMNAFAQAQQARQVAMSRFVGATALAGVGAVGSLLNIGAQNITSGELDPMTAAGTWGAAGGSATAIAGALVIGAMSHRPPSAEALGIAGIAGGIMGSAVAQYRQAPYVRTRTAVMEMAGVSARQGKDPYSIYLPGRGSAPGTSLEELSDDITYQGKSAANRTMIKMGLYTGTDIASPLTLARTYSSIAGGMLDAGDDTARAVDDTARLGRKYGMAAPGMAQMARQGYAARNRTGRNDTDLLFAIGTESYGAYMDATGHPDLSPKQKTLFGDSQRNGYNAELGSLQVRGSGAAAAAAFSAQRDSIGGLPGGKDSLAYAQAGAQYRDALFTGYGQQDTISFGVPMAHLSGTLERMSLLPFNPGNIMHTQLQMSSLAAKQAQTLQARLDKEKKSGNLSEDMEFRLTQQIEGLQTDAMRGVALLADDLPNRLPAMSAGKPAYAARFSSFDLAAMAVRGTGNRSFGAVGGRQLREQDDFLRPFAGGQDVSPHSRTQNLNNGLDSSAAVQILQQILEAIKTTNGGGMKSGMRVNEATGAVASAVYGKRVGQEQGHVN